MLNYPELIAYLAASPESPSSGQSLTAGCTSGTATTTHLQAATAGRLVCHTALQDPMPGQLRPGPSRHNFRLEQSSPSPTSRWSLSDWMSGAGTIFLMPVCLAIMIHNGIDTRFLLRRERTVPQGLAPALFTILPSPPSGSRRKGLPGPGGACRTARPGRAAGGRRQDDREPEAVAPRKRGHYRKRRRMCRALVGIYRGNRLVNPTWQDNYPPSTSNPSPAAPRWSLTVPAEASNPSSGNRIHRGTGRCKRPLRLPCNKYGAGAGRSGAPSCQVTMRSAISTRASALDRIHQTLRQPVT